MSPRLHRGIQNFGDERSSLVAIGNFDGVHRGHRHVLEVACKLAGQAGLTPVVLTFDPHPAQVLFDAKVSRLCTLSRKIELLLRQAPELEVVVEPFSVALSRLSPEDFAQSVLCQGLGARHVVVGDNFRFGHERAGDLARLSSLGRELGFETSVQALVGDTRGVFSSTSVREALEGGDLERATAILGRPHALSGRVVTGDRRGRTLGFPTANLAGIVEALPRAGVYAVLVDVEDRTGFRRLGLGAMNTGKRPTVVADAATEVHVLDFEGELYERTLRVHLIARLRDEQRFSGLSALKEQLVLDIARARQELSGVAPAPEAGAAWF